MKKSLIALFALFLIQSCIPLRVAPQIEHYKVSKGKKFKKGLPQREMFIFEDPKQAGEFYGYVNTKFKLDDIEVQDDVPFKLEGTQYFFSFYEVEIPDKHLNLFPAILNKATNELLQSEDEEYFTGGDIERQENWYIAIEVYNDVEKDCLSTEALSRELVLNYLRGLREEYLATTNYNELVFKN